MTTTIFLDECGYTGDDLLDSDQPTFAIATHSFSEEESDALKRQFFADVKAPALKHKSLQGRARNQVAIIAFLRFLLEQPGRARVIFADKRFALTAKLVDIIIEPGMHRGGLNLYEEGGNAALSNLFFAVFRVEGSSVLDQLLARFQRYVRERSEDAAQEFFKFVFNPQPVRPIDETLDWIREAVAALQPNDILDLPPRSLDLSLTMALTSVYTWREAGHAAMRVVHDRSKNMARQADLWTTILAPSAPPALVGQGPFSVQFPIGVESTEFRNSNESSALQLADVIAGAVARWTRWIVRGASENDAYGVSLHELLSPSPDSLVTAAIWPTESVDRRERTPANVQDSLAYVTERARVAQRNASSEMLHCAADGTVGAIPRNCGR